MKRLFWAGALAMAFAAPAHAGRDLCRMLRDKGILNELEYNECNASQEQEEANVTKQAQDFTKSWIQYKEGTGFIFTDSSERFQFSIGNRIQFRYTYDSPSGAGKDDTSSFRVRRMKTFFHGYAFAPWVKYKVQVNWVGSSTNGSQAPNLEDAFVDLAYFPMLSGQAGQYKVPFNRQELTSSGAQEFVDRSIASEKFSFGRDQGFSVHGAFGEPKMEYLEYWAGIFNGNGINKPANSDASNMGAGRIYYTPLGPMKYSESDVEYSPKPLVAIGAAAAYNPLQATSTSGGTTLVTDSDIYSFTSDVQFKWRGLYLVGDYFFRTVDNQPGGTVKANGVTTQVGYFLIPKHLEIAGRYSMTDPTGPDNMQQEARGALSWYFYGHNLKLQSDYGTVITQVANAPNQDDFQARLQLQVIF